MSSIETTYRKDEGREIKESRLPTIDLLGYTIDRDALIVGVCVLLLWILLCLFILRNTGLSTVFSMAIGLIMLLFAVYIIASVFSSEPSAGGVVFELANLTSVEQMISVITGSFILFFGLMLFLPSPDDRMKRVLCSLSLVSMLLIGAISMWVNTIMTGRAFRNLRKIKQAGYNIVLCLFIIQIWILLASYSK